MPRERQMAGADTDRGSAKEGARQRSSASTGAAGNHNQSRILKDILKQQIRIRGMRYQDIADHLGVSVMTIKRYLNAERVPIEAIEDIATCLGLSLIELAEFAKANDGRQTLDLELQQESALAASYELALVRLLLYNGLTVEEIMTEYGVDEPTLVGLLTRLDRLKLIELLPGNRVRIRGSRHIEWRRGGPMRRQIEQDIRENFVKMDFANTESFYGYETARLSRSSVLQIEEHMRQLVRTMRILQKVDQGVPIEQKQWYSLLVAQRETNWGFPFPNGEFRAPRSLGPNGTVYPANRGG
ncbi:XRE family transcriptional regulator [Caenibius tardaugens NBRC 16725]|nr:XRE family transcriptional regulator [Caenibius tardaugens NBRC 16725]